MEYGYWIDDDGFIAHGKGDDYTTVSGEIIPLHVAPLKAIIESHAELLEACKALLTAPLDNPDHLLRAQKDAEQAIAAAKVTK